MAESVLEPWGLEWVKAKLDQKRRARELQQYVDEWLPELKTAPPGLCIDVGCGPGDLLAILRGYGHEILGIDAPNGDGGMGDPYLEESRKWRQKFNVPVDESGLVDAYPRLFSDRRGTAACITARGSIEQAAAKCMIGVAHDRHHNCRELDWDRQRGSDFLRTFVRLSHDLLRPGGILLISANGSRCSDDWYDKTIREWAKWAGLNLDSRQGLLTHKWRKPDDAQLTERANSRNNGG